MPVIRCFIKMYDNNQYVKRSRLMPFLRVLLHRTSLSWKLKLVCCFLYVHNYYATSHLPVFKLNQSTKAGFFFEAGFHFQEWVMHSKYLTVLLSTCLPVCGKRSHFIPSGQGHLWFWRENLSLKCQIVCQYLR